PPPPPEPEPTPQPRKRYTKRTVKPPPPPPPPPEPTPTAGPTVVDGLIVRVTPSDDNTSVTISARLKGKVRKGASGQVMRNGKPLPGGAFRVSNARGRNVDAKVNLPEGRFTGRLTVQVQGD
ncbi:hypothetical protein KKB55_21405, partial [Myxococcota bacterium]|nr:hypothetical protein [Myxococcota bacterium]